MALNKETRNSATVNEGTQTSGGLGPSRLDSAQTRQDGPTQQSAQSAPEIKASESNRIENSTKTSSLLLQRVRIMAPHVRSPSPPQKMPWTDQLKGNREDWVCWEHAPVNFRDDDITFVVKAVKRIEQILIHHYDIEMPDGQQGNVNFIDIIKKAKSISKIKGAEFKKMHHFRLIRNKLVHEVDYNELLDDPAKRRNLNTLCMEILWKLEGECNCKEHFRFEKIDSYRNCPSDKNEIIIFPDTQMFDGKNKHVDSLYRFVNMILEAQCGLASLPRGDATVTDGPKEVSSEESSLEMMENLIRNDPNLRDILDEDLSFLDDD